MVATIVQIAACFVGIVASSCVDTDCVSCTELHRCAWNESSKACSPLPASKYSSKHENIHMYDDTCPVEHHFIDVFLGEWMGELAQVGVNLTLLEMSLPGTHDTLTYDLSLRVSDGGIDGHDKRAEIMHRYQRMMPNELADFIRQQAQTQYLNVTMQLNSGIRFLDLRTMYEYSSEGGDADWYSLHFLQSNKRMIVYLKEIRDWLLAHPTELVVMWVSKHGSECRTGEGQYPNTPIEEKRRFWTKVESLFEGLMLSGSSSTFGKGKVYARVNETSVVDLVNRNSRAIFYVSDYEEMTGSSEEVLDGCKIDNLLGPSVDVEEYAMKWEQHVFMSSASQKQSGSKDQKFLLMSLATGVPSAQVEVAADVRFLHRGDQRSAIEQFAIHKCTNAFNIPKFHTWCPPTLLDVAALENYYKQITIDQVLSHRELGWAFPNAIYINGVDVGGTIRTGTQVPWRDSARSSNSTKPHLVTKYGYVDSIVAFNIYLACNRSVVRDHAASPAAQKCAELQTAIELRRKKFPVSLWDDDSFGRRADWPSVPSLRAVVI